MGDVLTLIEKAQEHIAEEEAEELSRKMLSAEFNLEDFREQMRRLRNMGPLEGLLKLIPGMGALRDKLGDMAPPEKELNRVEAIINSMTKQERATPKILNASRRVRVAKGSGTNVAEVNKLLRQFEQMREMMKKMGKGGGMGAMPGMGGGLGGLAGGMPGLGGLGGMGGMPGLGGMGGAPIRGMSKAQKDKKKAERKRERQNKKRR